MTIEMAWAADRGSRTSYEDTCAGVLLSPCGWPDAPLVVAGLFDGVGGEDGGDVASILARRITMPSLCGALVTASLPNPLNGQPRHGTPHKPPITALNPDNVLQKMQRSYQLANDIVLRHAATDPRLAAMATTAVLVVIANRIIHLLWAGDSRCYLYRKGTLRQLTRDHSHVQRLVDSGVLDPRQAQRHPLAHAIYRCLGREDDGAAQTHLSPACSGDVLILCSDGLTDALSDQQIRQLLNRHGHESNHFRGLPERLLDAAVRRGIDDNTTLLCIRYDTAQPACPNRTVTAGYFAERASILAHVA